LRLYCDYVEYPKAIIKYNSNYISLKDLRNIEIPLDKSMVNFMPILSEVNINFYLCVGETCYAPTKTIEELIVQIKNVI
jgi:hypothetical protein